MYKLAFVLLACVAVAMGAMSRIPPQEKPAEFANQEGCYIPSLNRVIPYSTSYYPNDDSCTQYTCQTNGETIVDSCGVTEAAGNCQVVNGDLTQTYPNCCKAIVCVAK